MTLTTYRNRYRLAVVIAAAAVVVSVAALVAGEIAPFHQLLIDFAVWVTTR